MDYVKRKGKKRIETEFNPPDKGGGEGGLVFPPSQGG